MFERPQVGEKAVLVHVFFQDERVREELDEFKELVQSAGATTLTCITAVRKTPEAKYFIGKGKLEEIAETVQTMQADLVIFNHDLSPAQERNIEQVLQRRVLDRTGLILDIFAQRAHTFEGKLQVELAQLEHLSTRLVRGWTHLERQKGGIGLRGPGETQLETDRRLIRQRMKTIHKRLEKVQKQREQSRRARRRRAVSTVSFVGYTNAGKSTLFNALTDANTLAADQLFATLDPTLRRVEIPVIGSVILADTVGFIRHLPHTLVAAFRATLEETNQADLLIHVIDASDPERQAHIEEVYKVLNIIGADNRPTVEVFNKIDCVEGLAPGVDKDASGMINRVYLSALKQQGLDELKCAITQWLSQNTIQTTLSLPTTVGGKLRAKLYELNAVCSERVGDDGQCQIEVVIGRADLTSLFQQEALNWHDYVVDT